MSFNEKILMQFGEITGEVIAILILYNIAVNIIKSLVMRLFKYFGIEYFAEIIDSYKWSGQCVIEARAILNADRTCFYRCSNGKFYLENNSHLNQNIKVKSVVNRVRNRGMISLPEKLHKEYQEWFLQMQESDELIEMFTPDIQVQSPIRNMLNKLGVVSYMAVKIRRENELYGILVFTWSDVRISPTNLLKKHQEYLQGVRNTLLNETLFVIDRTLKYKLRKLLRMEV